MPDRIMLARTDEEFKRAISEVLREIRSSQIRTENRVGDVEHHLKTLNGRVGKSEDIIVIHEAEMNKARGAVGVGKWLWGALAALAGAVGGVLKDQVAK